MTKKIKTKDRFLIGIIPDTQGHLPPEVRKAFAGVNLIIHAGDIGEPDIINAPEEMAPTIAERGNMNMGRMSFSSIL